jgi:hypothetical protein
MKGQKKSRLVSGALIISSVLSHLIHVFYLCHVFKKFNVFFLNLFYLRVLEAQPFFLQRALL